MTCCFFFFFQAEDGIRDVHVTGVQTCALPIYPQVRGSNPGGPTTETAGRWLVLWCSNDGPTIRSAYFQFLPSGHSDVGTSTTTPSYPPSVTLGAGAVGPAVDRTTRPPAWSIWRGEGPRFRWTWTVPFGCQRSNENTSSGAGSDR